MLTDTQYSALKAHIQTNQDLAALVTAGEYGPVADALNLPYSPETRAWDRFVAIDRIHDAIDYTKYTPADAPNETLLGLQRMGAINIKQMNLQTMTMGREFLDASKANVRNGLKDATTAVPAGPNGANVHPGGGSGVAVMSACLREALVTKVEKLFSAGPATTGAVTAEALTFEGALQWPDVKVAWQEY